MQNEQLSHSAEQALSTKVRILSKYGIQPEKLDSIYDLVLGRPGYNAFALMGLSEKDRADLVEAIHTIFMECNIDAKSA